MTRGRFSIDLRFEENENLKKDLEDAEIVLEVIRAQISQDIKTLQP